MSLKVDNKKNKIKKEKELLHNYWTIIFKKQRDRLSESEGYEGSASWPLLTRNAN